VLLATKNRDKARIVERLLKEVLHDVEVASFLDIGFELEEEEKGTLLERARQKTQLFLRNTTEYNDFQILIGIDDGIGIAYEEPSVDSRGMTERILLEDSVRRGDVIVIARAFHMVNLETGDSASCLTQIPFIFLGNEAGVRWGDMPYPLGLVLAPEEGKPPVAQMDQEQAHAHTSKYSLLFIEEALHTVI